MGGTSRCKDCGEELTWDEKVKSQSGKMIPLEKNGNKHNCPFSKFNKTPDKSLGDKTPMEALSTMLKDLSDLKKRVDRLEIEQRWGGAKTEIDTKEVQTTNEKNDNIDWDKYRTSPKDKNNDEMDFSRFQT